MMATPKMDECFSSSLMIPPGSVNLRKRPADEIHGGINPDQIDCKRVCSPYKLRNHSTKSEILTKVKSPSAENGNFALCLEGGCVMCRSANLLQLNSQNAKKSQTLISNLLEILGPGQDFDIQKKLDAIFLPFCSSCFNSVKELVDVQSRLLVLQQRYKNLKNEIVSALNKNGKRGDEQTTTTPPTSAPTTKLELDAVEIKDEEEEYTFQASPHSFTHVDIDYPNSETDDDAANEDVESDSEVVETRHEELAVSESLDLEDPLEIPLPDFEISVPSSICISFDRRKRGSEDDIHLSRWKLLANCPATRPGLEQLVPATLLRIICPICSTMINPTPASITKHMSKHSRKEKVSVEPRLQAVAMEALRRKVRAEDRRRALRQKWAVFHQQKDHLKDDDSVSPLVARRFQKQTCPTCNKIFFDIHRLKEHVNMHTGARPHQCTECPKTFTRSSNLATHRLSHVGKILFHDYDHACALCPNEAYFTGRKAFCDHMQSQHADHQVDLIYFHHCDFKDCIKVYSDKTQFLAHLTTHDPEGQGGSFPCTSGACDKVFAGVENLDAHLTAFHENTNEDKPGFICKYCDWCFKTESLFTRHEATHGVPLTAVLPTHLCDFCGKEFKFKISLDQHKYQLHIKPQRAQQSTGSASPKKNCATATNTPASRKSKKIGPRKPRQSTTGIVYNRERKDCNNSDPIFFRRTCSICNYECHAEFTMTNHMLETHTYVNGLMCYICSRPFHRLGMLEAHIRQHLGEARKTAKPKCSYCGLQLAGVIPMQRHLVENHPQEHLIQAGMPFHCEVCWRRFVTADEVASHQTQIHDKWKCTYCGKQCVNKFKFECHVRIHTKETPFQCGICGREFNVEAILIEHMMRHKGEKRFYCQLCPGTPGVGFFRKKQLLDHLTAEHGFSGTTLDPTVCRSFATTTTTAGDEGGGLLEV